MSVLSNRTSASIAAVQAVVGFPGLSGYCPNETWTISPTCPVNYVLYMLCPVDQVQSI